MATLNIHRLPGEDEAEYQKRYNREKRRIYRANLPRVGRGRKPGQRNKGPKADGLLSQAEWESLQQVPGESDEAWKLRKQRERQAAWRARNPERAAELAKANYANNRERELERNRQYRAGNSDRLREYSSAYYRKNKERRVAAIKAWAKANPDRVRARAAKWREENRALCAFYSATWRKACRDQTPIWANPEKILAVYAAALEISRATGIPQHVDHEIPLRGENVSGLHVETNLRIIPAIENMRKHNKLLE